MLAGDSSKLRHVIQLTRLTTKRKFWHSQAKKKHAYTGPMLQEAEAWEQISKFWDLRIQQNIFFYIYSVVYCKVNKEAINNLNSQHVVSDIL